MATCKAAKEIIDTNGRTPYIISMLEAALLEPLENNNRINKLKMDLENNQIKVDLEIVENLNYESDNMDRFVSRQTYNFRSPVNETELVHVKNWCSCLLDNFDNIEHLELKNIDLDFDIKHVKYLVVNYFTLNTLVHESVRELKLIEDQDVYHDDDYLICYLSTLNYRKINNIFPSLDVLTTPMLSNVDEGENNIDLVIVKYVKKILKRLISNKTFFKLIISGFYEFEYEAAFSPDYVNPIRNAQLNIMFTNIAESIGAFSYNQETHTFTYENIMPKRD